MGDGRSNRKAKVVPFIDRLERDRKENLEALVCKAKQMNLEGFESVNWDDAIWQITGGRLVMITGRNSKSSTFSFSLPQKLGAYKLFGSWKEVAKALFVLRFHRKHQSTSSQRNFITSIAYVSFSAEQLGQDLHKLTPEVLDNACFLISSHYGEATAYNLHKYVAEFGAHCDANGLCRVLLQYKYANMKRPANTGGLNHKRLDDPEVLETNSEKLVGPVVFRVLGELYLKVPKDHKYRFYILILSLLACTGRRYSEIALSPSQQLSFDDEGNAYIEYFPRKFSRGDVFSPRRRLYLPSDVVPIVEQVLSELVDLTHEARSTAEYMVKNRRADTRFLNHIPNNLKLFKSNLKQLGIPQGIIDARGWCGKNAQVFTEITSVGSVVSRPMPFTYRKSIEEYCQKDFHLSAVQPVHVDQFGREYYLHDLLFVRYQGLSSGVYSHWIATQCTHSMFTTFLGYFPALAAEYASSSIDVNFTSHHFRHTLNTLLDEGGLSDLLQTEWFGRNNPRDTKAYQHTSREKRALMLREDLKKGLVGGQLAEQIKAVPLNVQEAILKARIQAVHDVGTGICIHNFSQTPCGRHLQCSADCKDYVWAKDDKGRLDEQKRQYALTAIARQNAEKQLNSNKPKKSADWLAHNDKKLKTLAAQLANNGVRELDPEQYLSEVVHG
ncbi:TPA: integrase [Pseudomonas aeruginosa]|nr:integrase [Pseudomonas aeruginosa]HEJ3332474.1 integrase [Pseudomonas aeruginosa]HEJ5005992.1 integrase [Pseudomonas aeruginosa]HEJ5060666.1 integrase [Pseudomonas aeruginosa]HEK3716743.1 integrase [Pseudomonas aeruginosa]